VERLARKLERRTNVGLSDLCQLYRASSKLPGIVSELSRHQGPGASVLQRRFAEPLATAHDQGGLEPSLFEA
jgi:DNA mismatch repair protein MSH2